MQDPDAADAGQRSRAPGGDLGRDPPPRAAHRVFEVLEERGAQIFGAGGAGFSEAEYAQLIAPSCPRMRASTLFSGAAKTWMPGTRPGMAYWARHLNKSTSAAGERAGSSISRRSAATRRRAARRAGR